MPKTSFALNSMELVAMIRNTPRDSTLARFAER